jgi:hypothetical protein
VFAVADTVEFSYNFAEIGLFLRTSPELRAYLEDLGRKGVEYARSIAPVGTRTTKHSKPGQYRDSIKFEVTASKTRLYLRIFSDDFTAWWIEYGSIKMPKSAVLRRTLDYLASGHAQAASGYAGVSEYDAGNLGTQTKRRARRVQRAIASVRR